MDTPRSFRHFISTSSGSVAVESALLIFLFMFVLLLFKEAIDTAQMEGATHRATAAAADVIANQRLAEGDTVQDALRDFGGDEVSRMFREMIAGGLDENSEALQTGLTVTYYSTAEDGAREVTYTYGDLSCGGTERGALVQRGTPGAGGALVTNANHGRLKLVRVEGCASLSGAVSLGSLIFPTSFASSFTAVRREE